MLLSRAAEFSQSLIQTYAPSTISFVAPTYLFVESIVLKQGQGL